METISIVAKGKISLDKAQEEIMDYIEEVFKEQGYPVNTSGSKVTIIGEFAGYEAKVIVSFHKIGGGLSIKISGQKLVDEREAVCDAIHEKIDELEGIELKGQEKENESENIADIPKLIEDLHKLMQKKLISEKEFEEKKKKLLDMI